MTAEFNAAANKFLAKLVSDFLFQQEPDYNFRFKSTQTVQIAHIELKPEKTEYKYFFNNCSVTIYSTPVFSIKEFLCIDIVYSYKHKGGSSNVDSYKVNLNFYKLELMRVGNDFHRWNYETDKPFETKFL